MPQKFSTRRKHIVLDSDDDIDKSVACSVSLLDSDDGAPFPTASAPASGPRPLHPSSPDGNNDQGDGFESLVRQTIQLYKEDQDDADFAPDLDDVAEVEEGDDGEWDGQAEDDWDESEQQPTPNQSDWAEVISNTSKGERFLPPFLDRLAKLDKYYPIIESFIADNKAEI